MYQPGLSLFKFISLAPVKLLFGGTAFHALSQNVLKIYFIQTKTVSWPAKTNRNQLIRVGVVARKHGRRPYHR